MRESNKKYKQFLLENIKGRDQLQDLSVDGGAMLRRILKVSGVHWIRVD
jgi:hypothetical protein